MIKLQARVASLAKRASVHASSHEDVVVGAVSAAAFALAEKKYPTSMPTVMGLDPALVYGAVLYLGGRKIATGKMGSRIEHAGSSLLTLASARAVMRGSLKTKVGGVDEDDDLTDDGDE